MGDFRFVFRTPRYSETVAFYAETLGFPVIDSWDEAAGRGTLLRALGDGCVEVFEADGETPALSGVMISVEVDDVDGFHDRLVNAGVPVARPPTDQPWGDRNMEVHDPNGLPIVLFTVVGSESS